MGDKECESLRTNGELPGTQPYQTVVEGAAGYRYAFKYLSGQKWVDSSPTTVVEFVVRKTLVAELFARQHKPEDGVMSMGLGHTAGKGLGIFNDALRTGESTWRIVVVKRKLKQDAGKAHRKKN